MSRSRSVSINQALWDPMVPHKVIRVLPSLKIKPLVTLVAMTVQVPLHDSESMTTTWILPVRVDHAFEEWSRSKDFER